MTDTSKFCCCLGVVLPNAPRRAASEGQEGGGEEEDEVEGVETVLSARRASYLVDLAGRQGIERFLETFVCRIEPKYGEGCSALFIAFNDGIFCKIRTD